MNLKPGTLCIVVGGLRANVGVVIEVIAHLGPCHGRADVYHVQTVSGRPFSQLWDESGRRPILRIDLNLNYCYIERHKLRPLVDPKGEEPARAAKRVKGRKKELAATD